MKEDFGDLAPSGAMKLADKAASEIEPIGCREIATLPLAVKLPSAVMESLTLQVERCERKRAMDHGTRYDVPKGQRTWYHGTRLRVRGIM